MRCERCQELMVEAFYGELDETTQRELDEHVAGCEACTSEADSLRGALEMMNRRDRPDPGSEYWDGYYERLAARMERDAVRVVAAAPWWRRSAGRWSYRVAAAAAILLVGVFAGRTFFAPSGPASEPQVAVETPGARGGDVERPDVSTTTPPAGEATQQPAVPERTTDVADASNETTSAADDGGGEATTAPRTSAPVPRTTAPARGGDAQVASSSNDRAMRYIEKSQLLLIALVNNDADGPDAYAAGLGEQRRRSRTLVDEGDSIKDELTDPRQRRLRELVDELQKILIQIANLESDEDMDAVEFIRSRVNDHDVLLKINLEQMRQGSDADGAARDEVRGADSKRSI